MACCATGANLAAILATGGDGATTVAGTMICAAAAGIGVLATGGLGGVHRGAERTLDVSADLAELARTSVAVLCSGAKSILDLPKTLEVRETHGVPVIGFGTDRFPAFHARDCGLPLELTVDGVEALADILRIRSELGLAGGVVIANPVPEEHAIEFAVLERWIERAHAEAATGASRRRPCDDTRRERCGAHALPSRPAREHKRGWTSWASSMSNTFLASVVLTHGVTMEMKERLSRRL